MASKLRPIRVTLSNLQPAPGSQQNVRIIAFVAWSIPYAFCSPSKNASVAVKVLDTEERLVVVIKDRRHVRDLGLDQDLKVVKHPSQNFSPNVVS